MHEMDMFEVGKEADIYIPYTTSTGGDRLMRLEVLQDGCPQYTGVILVNLFNDDEGVEMLHEGGVRDIAVTLLGTVQKRSLKLIETVEMIELRKPWTYIWMLDKDDTMIWVCLNKKGERIEIPKDLSILQEKL